MQLILLRRCQKVQNALHAPQTGYVPFSRPDRTGQGRAGHRTVFVASVTLLCTRQAAFHGMFAGCHWQRHPVSR